MAIAAPGQWRKYLRQNGRWSLWHRFVRVAPDRNADEVACGWTYCEDDLIDPGYLESTGERDRIEIRHGLYELDVPVACRDCLAGRISEDHARRAVGFRR